MDLDEYALSEAQRTLKRLGVTHLWREAGPAEPSLPGAATDFAKPSPPRPAMIGRPAPNRREEPLPPILRTLFHGKQPPVGTLWTYAGLLADLQQADAPARLDMFRKIQASARTHLGWSENDICAWPLDVSPAVFHHGLQFFCPRIVIVFGPGTRLPAAPVAVDAETTQSEPAIIVLPGLDDMAAGNKQLKNDAWQILQGIRL